MNHDNDQDDMQSSLPTTGVAETITWAVLNQKHDCYDAKKLDKLRLLLKGGNEIIKSACLFMPKLRAESKPAYEDRLQFATYENHFGGIANDFASTLFSKPIAILPATDAKDDGTPGDLPDESLPYMQWQRHFTLDKRSMTDFMKDIQIESNGLSISYFGVDFTTDRDTGASRPYAYYIDPVSVLDWEKDDEGNYLFIVMRSDTSVRRSVKEIRNTVTSTFTVWTRDPETEKVSCDRYEITYKRDEEPAPLKPVPKLPNQAEELKFRHIPIIDCVTPESLSIGELIGALSSSMYQRYTSFLFCLNRGLNPLLIYKQGAEFPENGDLSEIADDEYRGERITELASTTGKGVIGPNDEVSWVEPVGTAYKIAQEQLQQDKNELYRLVNCLSSVIQIKGQTSANVNASGLSKQMDNKAKEHMLEAYADLLKSWLLKAFLYVYEAEGQDVVFQPKGMDNYKVVDEDTLLNRIKAIPDYKNNIPSKTSLKQLLLDTVQEMHPYTNVGTLQKIQDEINENVEKMNMDELHTATNPAAVQAGELQKATPPQVKPFGKK